MYTVFDLYHYLIKDPAVITILREPIKHALSWACFYNLPQTLKDLEAKVKSLKPNKVCEEFGIVTLEQLKYFIANHFPKFELVCISEFFDECMVMMRRRFNWSLLDITYLRLLDSEDVRFVATIALFFVH